jgi:hypothetical protein
MKGTINLHEKWGWGVMNHMDESIPDWIPLHPDDLTHFAEMKEKFDNFEARVLSSPEVEFETIIHPKFTGRIIYAKLNTKEEPKQETLEEAAEKEFPLIDTEWCRTGACEEENLQLLGHRRSFIKGANWQAERMYSEEDLIYAFNEGQALNVRGRLIQGKEWFEQFKKK